MHSQRHCCICSANYCKFHLISLLVWLADMTALFLMMCPLSWYQFCVSLPLEGRTVSLVLFLQVQTPLSVLHCFPPAGHVDPVFSDNTFSAAVRHNSEHREERVACCLCHPCPPLHSTWSSVSGNCCHTSPPPHPSWSQVYPISTLQEMCQESHTDWEEEGRMRRGRSNWSSGFHDRLPSSSSNSPTFCHQPAELDFHHFNSALLSHSDECQHDTTAIPPASPPSYRDDLTSYSLSAPLHPPYKIAASHSP